MAVRRNGYYNNPAIGAAVASLSQLFAPPSGADAAGWAAARAKEQEAAQLAEMFRVVTDPNTDRSMIDRYGIAVGRFNPNQSFYAVDQSNATLRANNAADNARALEQTRLQQRGETERTLLAPVGAGQTRFVPPGIADMFGLPPQQVGVVELDQGKSYIIPGRDEPVAGPAKPATLDEMKAQVYGQMPVEQQQAIVFGSTPIEQIVRDGRPVNVTRLEALGAEPYIAPDKAPKYTNAIAVMPDGITRVPAVQGPDGRWRHAQTGADLPADVQIFDIPKPQGTASDVGLTPPILSQMQRELLALGQTKDTALRLRELIAQSPASQGVVGALRGTAQNLIQTGRELGAWAGGEVDNIMRTIEQNAMDRGLLENFDKNIPAIEMLSNILAFQYAKTLTGERLSNEMLRTAKRALGLEGLTANQPDALARIDEALKSIQRREETIRRALAGGVDALQSPLIAPIEPSPMPRAGSSHERWERGPDGKLRRVQ